MSIASFYQANTPTQIMILVAGAFGVLSGIVWWIACALPSLDDATPQGRRSKMLNRWAALCATCTAILGTAVGYVGAMN